MSRHLVFACLALQLCGQGVALEQEDCSGPEQDDESALLAKVSLAQRSHRFLPDALDKLKGAVAPDAVDKLKGAAKDLSHGKLPDVVTSVTAGLADKIATQVNDTLRTVDEQADVFDKFASKAAADLKAQIASEKTDKVGRFNTLVNETAEKVGVYWAPLEKSLQGASTVAVSSLTMFGQKEVAADINTTFAGALEKAKSFRASVLAGSKEFAASFKDDAGAALSKLNETLRNALASAESLSASFDDGFAQMVEAASSGIGAKTSSKDLEAQARTALEPVQKTAKSITTKLTKAAERLLGSVQSTTAELGVPLKSGATHAAASTLTASFLIGLAVFN